MPRAALLCLFLSSASLASAQTPDFVVYSYETRQAELTVTLNGFPLTVTTAEQSGFGTQPVNLHLRPTGNRLTVSYRPLVPEGGVPADTTQAYLRLALASAQAGSMVDTGDAGDLVSIERTGAGGRLDTVATFDLPADWATRMALGARYDTLPVLADEDALRAYAHALLLRFAERDMDAVLEAFRPFLEDQHQAMAPQLGGMARDAFMRRTHEDLDANLAQMTTPTDVSPEALVLTPWAEGRLWKVTRPDGRALLLAEDGEGGTISFHIYLGEVDGALHVVR
ncbi:MAG: hypothetical protein R3247_07145 [Rhodothermales bacterium]|nr:hypothetical protein [Rhodothermales bacterium]